MLRSVAISTESFRELCLFWLRTGVLVMVLALAAQPGAIAQIQIATGLQGAQGSAVGPYGHLYVTEGAAGRISRIDRRTGQVTTFHEGGLPRSIIGIGGVVDVLFLGRTAYALVTLVSEFNGGTDGIYRIDGPHEATLVADLGAFAAANPPETSFFLNKGVFFSLESYDSGFLVTDGHHNRILRVSRYGRISVFRAFENIVPTGLETYGDAVFMAHAGPIPHLPENGKIIGLWPELPFVVDVASGAPLLVDVEMGRERSLFGLAQGYWPHDPNNPGNAGLPAEPRTGLLVRVNAENGFDVVADGLNLPTSLEIIGNDAYIVSLAGEVWKVPDVLASRGHSKHHHDSYDKRDDHHDDRD